jgi:2-C-methyl-D-erythritol 4-phosphate cytidylyltransferase
MARPKLTEQAIAVKLEEYRKAVVAALKERDTLKWANTDKRSMLREHYEAQLAILKHQEAEAQRKYANAKSAYRDFYKKHCKKD